MTLLEDNVTFDTAGRYRIISEEPIWSIQQMCANVNFDGSFPEIATVKQRPVISAGQGLWAELDKGGDFSFQSCGRPVTIEAMYAKNATFTYSILMPNSLTRSMPTTFPFNLAAGEKIRVTSTGAAGLAEVGFLARYTKTES